MNTFYACTLSVFFLTLAGCSGDGDKTTDSSTSATSTASTAFVPTEGSWAFGTGSWFTDECEAVFMSNATGWTLSNATETSFDVSIQFDQVGSLPAEPSCTLTDRVYSCGVVVQQFSVGGGNISLAATAAGSFSSATAGELQVTFDIECSGDCAGLMAANPCTSIQTFNVSM